MDGVIPESKQSVGTPTEWPSSGNSEKNSGFKKETAVVVAPGEGDASQSNGDGKEGGGYASYAVRATTATTARTLPGAGLTACIRSYGGTQRLST